MLLILFAHSSGRLTLPCFAAIWFREVLGTQEYRLKLRSGAEVVVPARDHMLAGLLYVSAACE